jgi:hypothetical protein
MVGKDDRNMTGEINQRRSSDILTQGISNSKLAVLPNERHSYCFANPDWAHKKRPRIQLGINPAIVEKTELNILATLRDCSKFI